jgi:xanthine dehydrogenase accessory factor
MPSLELPDRRAAVATLVATEGSSPRDAGSRMWVDDRGAIVGSVTIGGCVDARVIEESARVLEHRRPVLMDMALGDEDAWALGMTCAGTVQVLIEPYDPSDPADPVRQALQLAASEVAAGRRAMVVAPLDEPRGRLVVFENAAPTGTLGSVVVDAVAVREATRRLADPDARSGTAVVSHAEGDVRLYFEVHAPPATLVVYRCRRRSRALCHSRALSDGERGDRRDALGDRRSFAPGTEHVGHPPFARLQIRLAGPAGRAGE